MKKYDELKGELPNIAKVVSNFPPSVQEKVYDLLLSSFLKGEISFMKQHEGKKQSMPPMPDETIPTGFEDIASISSDGNFHVSVRDLKAKNALDAAKRLAYVAIKTYTQLSGEKSVSRRKIITPLLRAWRLDDGNTRSKMATDPGIRKDGDQYSLDIHAQKEADEFIIQIRDPDISGQWRPGEKTTTRKKRASKQAVKK